MGSTIPESTLALIRNSLLFLITLEKNVAVSSTTESSLLSKQSTRKASLLEKLPDKLILSPDALQVSTVIGQGVQQFCYIELK